MFHLWNIDSLLYKNSRLSLCFSALTRNMSFWLDLHKHSAFGEISIIRDCTLAMFVMSFDTSLSTLPMQTDIAFCAHTWCLSQCRSWCLWPNAKVLHVQKWYRVITSDSFFHYLDFRASTLVYFTKSWLRANSLIYNFFSKLCKNVDNEAWHSLHQPNKNPKRKRQQQSRNNALHWQWTAL